MNKSSVLIVTSEFPPQPGGIGNHAYNLANHLSINNFLVTVISDSRSQSGEAEAVFDDTLSFNVVRISVNKIRFFMYFKRLWLLSKLLKTHTTVIASGKFSLWSIGFFSFFFKRKYLGVIHGSEVNLKSKFLNGITKIALKRLHKLIAVSNFTKELLESINLEKIEVIPNGFDTRLWGKDNLAIDFDNIKGSPRIITIGRISERKGQHHVIRKLPLLVKKYPKVQYHCVGIDKESKDCIELAKALEVQDHLTIHGEVSIERLKKLVRNSDISVMLSSETKSGDVEGFGIAILESNASGVPSIGSRNTGIEDAILHGKSGMLVNYDKDQEFLDAVELILKNKADFRLGALKWAEKHKWDVIINKYIDVINSI